MTADAASANASPPPPGPLPAIDRLKGVAILWVMCIHAAFGEGTIFFEHFVNRAVPVFIFLFGVTSEFWWEKRAPRGEGALREWYVGRLWRLMVPYWVMAAAWWTLVFVMSSGRTLPAADQLVLTAIGFAPWIAMSWFVMLIVQLVAWFPLARSVVAKVPAVVSLGVSAAITGTCAWYTYTIVDFGVLLFGDRAPPPAWYYAWIFSPRVVFPVVAGIVVARKLRGRPGPVLTAVGLAFVPASYFLLRRLHQLPDDMFVGSLREQVVFFLSDVPLCTGLLGIATLLPLPRFVAKPLEWCGRASWGLYISHLLVHEMVHAMVGTPEGGPQVIRGLYALFLFIMGTLVAVTSGFARRGLEWTWRRVAPPSADPAAR